MEVWEERAEATDEEGEEERGVEMSELAVLKEAKVDCDAICWEWEVEEEEGRGEKRGELRLLLLVVVVDVEAADEDLLGVEESVAVEMVADLSFPERVREEVASDDEEEDVE
jgi:hypothetical protein